MVEESKTIEGLWVALYISANVPVWELVRIKLDGDQAVATKLIGDDYVPAGEITWKASVTTGFGQLQTATLGFSTSGWNSCQLEIISSDRIRITRGTSTWSFRQVD